jgi:hypothetical protein
VEIRVIVLFTQSEFCAASNNNDPLKSHFAHTPASLSFEEQFCHTPLLQTLTPLQTPEPQESVKFSSTKELQLSSLLLHNSATEGLILELLSLQSVPFTGEDLSS